jgi:hypothetical protein
MKLIWAFFIFLLANNCEANDSIGYLGAGGIEFKKTQDISMEKEVLTISRKLIRVEYEFLNTTSKPIKETIVFPMPFYGFDAGCSPMHSGKLGGFKVWVNGILQNTSRTVRARLKGNDVTTRLRELGFADEDIAEYRGVDGGCGMDEHPPQGVFAKNIDVLVKDGLMNYFVENEHAEFPTYISMPLWESAYFYSWEQVFPPNAIVRVAHEYVPFTGSINGLYSFIDVSSFKKDKDGEGLVKNFCITDGTIRAGKNIQEHITTGAFQIPIEGLRREAVNYILTTGANWAGPIKDFTLNLKKESKNEIVSLCFDDGQFKKSDELTISSHIKNFVPKSDISAIFFYAPDPMAGYSKGGGYKPGYRRQRD